MLELVLYSLLLCFGTMFITWLVAMKIDNYSIVDAVWSYNFPLIALLLFFIADGSVERKLLTLLAVVLWAGRLGTHLLIRIMGHLDHEDGRYLTLREDYGDNLKFRFLMFYFMQAASNVFLAIPFFILMTSNQEMQVIEWIGIGVWAIAFIGEAASDRQLAAFKKDPNNKGKVCNVGLWSWSRHPNYFFEFMIWVGFATFCLASPMGWLAWICPASILFLLLKVTGIPLTEQQSIKSKGQAYLEYQKSTSMFVPLPPKK